MSKSSAYLPTAWLVGLLALSVRCAPAAPFDAGAYNAAQLAECRPGERTLIAVHGIRTFAADMDADAERVRQWGSGHDRVIGFEYRRTADVRRFFWALCADDNMEETATSEAGIKLAVFIAQVERRTGRSPDVFAHSQGTTVLLKAARWIRRIKESLSRRGDLTELTWDEDWHSLSADAKRLVRDNLDLLTGASVAVVVESGSPSSITDPARSDLEQLVEERTPSGNPAAFYLYAGKGVGEAEFWVNAVLGRRLRAGGPRQYSSEQIVFIRSRGHNDYLSDDLLGAGLLADIFSSRSLSPSMAAAVELHNGRSEEPESGPYFGWAQVKPRGSLSWVSVREVLPGALPGKMGEDVDTLLEEVAARARASGKPVLLYGEAAAADSLAAALTARWGLTVEKRYGPGVALGTREMAASLAVDAGADVALVVHDGADAEDALPHQGEPDRDEPDRDDEELLPPFFPPPPPPQGAAVSSPAWGPAFPRSRAPQGGEASPLPRHALPEAIRRGLVEPVAVASVGSPDGLRGILRLRKLTDQPFLLAVGPGTVLQSQDPFAQSLALW